MNQNINSGGLTANEIANELVARFAKAWRSHDAHNFESLFTKDIDRVHFCGDKIIGAENSRAECIKFQEQIFTEQPNISEDVHVESAHFITPEALLIDGTWSVQGFKGNPVPCGRFIWIAKLEADIWAVASARILMPCDFMPD